MKINPYVLNTLEGEVRVILKKLAQVKAGSAGKSAKEDVADDEYFVRNWLFSTKRMPTLVARWPTQHPPLRPITTPALRSTLLRLVVITMLAALVRISAD